MIMVFNTVHVQPSKPCHLNRLSFNFLEERNRRDLGKKIFKELG